MLNVTTDDEGLKELLETGSTSIKEYRSLPRNVVNKFVKVVQMMTTARSFESFIRYPSLRYERLKGDLSQYESVRLNDKYRLIFISSATEIVITDIELIKISNHYGDI